jgi:hypothetical protein
MNEILFIRENGHFGKCPTCGREERFIQIRIGQKIIELRCGMECFLTGGIFIRETFLMSNGLKPGAVFVKE